ncbi:MULTISPECIES: hypothetical protein [unclassified Enterococcus]|uniref:hypothetical protein n=1 Tax=unclassified Enterococcus TaxID=2608891 RepID=UPI0015564809|nr:MULTISPECIES: hypothetical protein [unclassified Enterococcus]MBS7578346.1 hypothetical protein [Enterococcus sp. MMGLQ5-2]MBS7585583.1 hypothetical protein [Enterococcus sp. MMGLQ5-1]NPD13442.1 hypothetical protein [Enterococcus sp. MMGLQ5-1]NPD38177.1 hypothetical protein [Enterococcus sp. MMGLQ5-2]
MLLLIIILVLLAIFIWYSILRRERIEKQMKKKNDNEQILKAKAVFKVNQTKNIRESAEQTIAVKRLRDALLNIIDNK